MTTRRERLLWQPLGTLIAAVWIGLIELPGRVDAWLADYGDADE